MRHSGSDNSGRAVAGSEDAASIIGDVPTAQGFTDEAVDETDLNAILTAGVNAPSAMNKQPWHFSVVTDKEVLQKISDDMGSGMKPGGKMPDGKAFDGKKPEGKRPEGKERPDKPEKGDFPDKSENGEFPKDGDMPTPSDGDMPAPPVGDGMIAKAGIADAPVAVIISCEDGTESF